MRTKIYTAREPIRVNGSVYCTLYMPSLWSYMSLYVQVRLRTALYNHNIRHTVDWVCVRIYGLVVAEGCVEISRAHTMKLKIRAI